MDTPTVLLVSTTLLLCIGVVTVIAHRRASRSSPPPRAPVPAGLGSEQRALPVASPAEALRLRELADAFEADDAGAWDALVAMGDVYRNGAFPRFLPDDDMALECYRLASRCPNGDVAGIAQSKYVQTRASPVSQADRAGAPMPVEHGRRALALASRRLAELPERTVYSRPKRIPEPEPAPALHDDHLDWAWVDAVATAAEATLIPVGAAVAAPPARYRADSQNVHDHGVTSATKKNLDGLRARSSARGEALSEEEIKDALLRKGNLSDAEALDALRVIDSLEGELRHSTLGVTEREALAVVWGRIRREPDAALRDNLTETLARQLASGVEHGHVVCSTGKIARIASTLEGAGLPDVAATARPTWAVKEELGTLAAKVREETLAGLDAASASAYERGEAPAAEERMRDEFRRRATATYVTDLGMSAAVVEPMLEAMEAAF
jgi:hypothetical protein